MLSKLRVSTREVNDFSVFVINFSLILSLLLQNFVFFSNPAYAATSTWAQTSQADFDGGTKSAVDTSTSSGNVTISKLSSWNSNYQYAKRITVSTGAAAVTNTYTVSIENLDTAALVTDGKMRNDGADANDLRIVYFDSSSSTWTELDRDVVNFNTTTTSIRFKLQTNIDASSTDNNYYLFYGYTSETSSPPSNKTNVYTFWDDFNDNSIDATKWTTSEAVAESGGILIIGTTALSKARGATLLNGAVFEAKLKWSSASTSPYVYGGFTNSGVTKYLFLSQRNWSVYNKNIATTTTNSVIADPLNWHTYKIQWESNTNGQYFIDDVIAATHTTDVPSENLGAYFCVVTNGYYLYVDDVKVRQYVNPEPTVSLGNEQTASVTYLDSGNLISSVYDTSLASNFTNISWTGAVPTDTTLKFQIRTATTQGRLSLASWYGPTSTSDYYEASGTTINSVHNGDRWIQYKLFLSTTDQTATPALSDISITYSSLSIASATQPILVIADSNSSNVYNTYITEILDAEGVLGYQTVDIYLYDVTLSYLNNFDIIILADTSSLSSGLVTALTSYVNSGGSLIGLSPDTQLASIFGLTNLDATTSEQYLKVDTTTTIGNGVTSESMQFHGDATDYSLNGASAIALIYSDASTSTTKPAISLYQYGSGSSIAFTYDLAKSTVLFHQGKYEYRSNGDNPDIDLSGTFTQNDLFYNYLDPTKAIIPQADEQQDVLVNAINYLTNLKKPLPRLWYYPNKTMSIAWITGDGDSATSAQIQAYADKTKEYGGYFTYFQWTGDEFNDTLDNSLQADGHSTAKHPNLGCGEPTLSYAQTQFNSQIQAFITDYGHQPLTDREHCINWVGWTENAEYLSANGIRINSDATLTAGGSKSYLNASGLPMKLMDENGDIVDLYEQSTVFYETTASETIDESFNNYHSVLTFSFHPYNSATKLSVLTTAVSYLQTKGIPMVSGDTWANFIDARRDMLFQNIVLTGKAHLTFDIIQGTRSIENATIMIPTNFGSLSVKTIQEEGVAKSYTTSTVDGVSYALFNISLSADQTKSYVVNYDEAAPTGSISINNGNNYVNSRVVTLSVSASDNLDDASSLQMEISNSSVKYPIF